MKDWWNTATPHTLYALADLNDVDFPARKKDIHDVVVSRLGDDSPSYHSVHRAVTALAEEGFVTTVSGFEGDRFELTPEGRDLLDDVDDPFQR